MKKRLFAALLAVVITLSLSGCELLRYSYVTSYQNEYPYEGKQIKFINYYADYLQEKYTEDECRAEAERLLGMSFEVVDRKGGVVGEGKTEYVLRSDSLPFEISVFSGRSGIAYDDTVNIFAHAYTDYYERAMDYYAEEAKGIADKYSLDVKRRGQDCYVYVSSYSQLEQVYDYLDETNSLYNFTVVEKEMTNILRDIRTRPMLEVYLDREAFTIPAGQTGKVVSLYYTVNHETYGYRKEALLPAIESKYIEALDSLGLSDHAVTDDIRAEVARRPITTIQINGEKIKKEKDKNGLFIPDITFEYNFLMGDYFADIMITTSRIVPVGYSYESFPKLVRLLGGEYRQWFDEVFSTSDFSTSHAEWTLGGHVFGATVIYQQNIPTISSYSMDGRVLDIVHYYSKEMWGLENGYGPEDFFVRFTPDGLAALLGVTAETDYEKGVLNLVTPEGYFEAEAPEKPAAESELFKVDKSLLNTHYIIYKNDGSVLEERTTKDYTYAECFLVSDSAVMLKEHGSGIPDSLTFFFTDTGDISAVYEWARLAKYPYVVYSELEPEGNNVYIENVVTKNRSLVTVSKSRITGIVTAASISEDGVSLTVTYYDLDRLGSESEKTETFNIKMP